MYQKNDSKIILKGMNLVTCHRFSYSHKDLNYHHAYIARNVKSRFELLRIKSDC